MFVYPKRDGEISRSVLISYVWYEVAKSCIYANVRDSSASS
jgi:hypothetical protein